MRGRNDNRRRNNAAEDDAQTDEVAKPADPTVAAIGTTLKRLIALTEQHLQAAIRLDRDAVTELNNRRLDLLFELKVRLSEAGEPSEAQRDALREATARLAELEVRLASVTQSVMGALNPLVPGASARTYGRDGRLAEQ